MKNNKWIFLVGIAVAIGMISSTGCATKKFVQGEMVNLDQKVEGVESGVEENQKRIREHDEQLDSIGSIISQHDERIKNVDGKIDSRIAEVKKYARGNLIFQETLRNKDAKFKFDSSELSDDAKVILDQFVKTLIEQDQGRYLEIQGHTDSSGPEDWNLILGKRRADAVMQYLYRQHHIPLHRMESISFGSSNPIADNSNRDGRSQNRRVEILVYE
jgi:outer membrane protein OmpA-like peptidoglycan-associated protein